jgi:excinuclease UvrABC ATPase subunit
MISGNFLPSSRLQCSQDSNRLTSPSTLKGGRCEECQGEGVIRVEMQFMADVELTCEACKGMRYKRDILDVRFNGKNILRSP